MAGERPYLLVEVGLAESGWRV